MFYELMFAFNPDIVIGYNIFGFDDNYLKIRSDMYKINDDLIKDLE
jgi:DNA polymerase elongation subunit (family B)